MIEKQYFTINEVADYLKVHPMSVRRLIHAKKIKALQLLNRSYRIPQSALNHFIHTNTK
jgi:excisionase family DNA binding protein